jgi:RimJ/RimL family protein N-acetyltransferase
MPTACAAGTATGLTLRPALLEDSALLFAWRNLPEIVELSTTQRTVTWEEHIAWFAQTLRSDIRLLRLLLWNGQPVGQVRFDRSGIASCQVSLYLLPAFTGRGLGVSALRQACAEVFQQWEVAEIVAHIRAENVRSLSAFAKAGFTPVSEPDKDVPKGHRALHLISAPEKETQRE